MEASSKQRSALTVIDCEMQGSHGTMELWESGIVGVWECGTAGVWNSRLAGLWSGSQCMMTIETLAVNLGGSLWVSSIIANISTLGLRLL